MSEFNNIKIAVDRLLGIKSTVKRKKQTKQIQSKEIFISVINSLQMLQNRANILYTDLNLDYSTYDEAFLEIIDALLHVKYGKEACEVISFYLWERINPDGSINDIFDENDNLVPLETPEDLWNVVQKLTDE